MLLWLSWHHHFDLRIEGRKFIVQPYLYLFTAQNKKSIFVPNLGLPISNQMSSKLLDAKVWQFHSSTHEWHEIVIF